jgi:hypothetical protein
MDEKWLFAYYSTQAKHGHNVYQIGGNDDADSFLGADYHKGIRFHRGFGVQRGDGIGGIFASLFRRIIPFFASKAVPALKSAVVPILKSTARDAGKSLLRAGLDTASAGLAGQNMKEAARENFERAGRNIASRTLDSVKSQIGSGNARKRKVRRAPSTRKKLAGVAAVLGYKGSRPPGVRPLFTRASLRAGGTVTKTRGIRKGKKRGRH